MRGGQRLTRRFLLITVSLNGAGADSLSALTSSPRLRCSRAVERLARAGIDPDVIEGHNVFDFDLPFLVARAERHGVTLRWGATARRCGRGPDKRAALQGGARSIPFTDCHVYGRHVVDTYQQIQRYDALGNLEHYGLKTAIEALGLTRAGRTFLPGAQIAERWQHEPRRCALRHRRRARRGALSTLTLPTEFYQSQIVPLGAPGGRDRGPGEKIDDLIVRAYLAAGTACRSARRRAPTPAATPRCAATGALPRRWSSADVESLYPSIMLGQGIAPAQRHARRSTCRCCAS